MPLCRDGLSRFGTLGVSEIKIRGAQGSHLPLRSSGGLDFLDGRGTDMYLQDTRSTKLIYQQITSECRWLRVQSQSLSDMLQ